MLDTNIVSISIHGRSERLDRRMLQATRDMLGVSIVSFGEIAFGLAKRPNATTLHKTANRLFSKIEILEFDLNAGAIYGSLRALLERRGTPLSPLDMLIAAHAVSVGATLISNDRAFRNVPGLAVEDWSQD